MSLFDNMIYIAVVLLFQFYNCSSTTIDLTSSSTSSSNNGSLSQSQNTRSYDYHLSSFNTATHTPCSEAGPNDICNIHCDQRNQDSLIIQGCGNASICNFYCNQTRCLQNGVITNSTNNYNHNLNVYGLADNCFNNATIKLPTGNASFHAMSNAAFKGITIHATKTTSNFTQQNTQKITMDCRGGYQESCHGLQGTYNLTKKILL